jgi:hypothetical protein
MRRLFFDVVNYIGNFPSLVTRERLEHKQPVACGKVSELIEGALHARGQEFHVKIWWEGEPQYTRYATFW